MKWLLLVALMSLIAQPLSAADGKVEIIAHRGESADAPENTMAAFKLAWQRNDDAIELDVHLTSDGQLILCHDFDTKRVAGVSKVIKSTPLDELRTLDAGLWKGPQWKGEKLPLLSEVLATIPDGKRCFIEIKIGPEAVPAVAAAVKASGKKPAQLAIISFKAPTIAAAKKQMPELPAYFLADFKQDKTTKEWSPTPEKMIEQTKACHADALNVSYKGPHITADFAKKVKAAGLGFYVWTVDDLEVARKMVAIGAAGITTNKAAWLKEQLHSK